jgi:hypothetical protein
MSGLRAAANRPDHPLQPDDVEQALRDAESLEVLIEATPWADVHRAWALARASLRYADAVYVAAAERHQTALLTADARIEGSGVPMTCTVITVGPLAHPRLRTGGYVGRVPAVSWILRWEADLARSDHARLSSLLSAVYPDQAAYFRDGRSWAHARPEGRVIGYDGARPVAHLGFVRRMLRAEGHRS